MALLEKCGDLHACEKILSQTVEGVCLLGDISLSKEDLEVLSEFIRQKITPSISRGTQYLNFETPTCLVYFLVGMGRYYDKESGYWPAIEEKIGLIDSNWQVRWGQTFLDFLLEHQLPKFDKEEGLTYVTPILGHFGIPEDCYEEYFEGILDPLVRRDLLNPFDEEEIIHDLNAIRRLNRKRLDLEPEKKERVEKLKKLRRKRRQFVDQIKKYKDIDSLLHAEDEAERKRNLLQGLEESEFDKEKYEQELEILGEKIRKLESQEKSLLEQFNSFGQKEKSILEQETDFCRIIYGYRDLTIVIAQLLVDDEEQLNELFSIWDYLSTKKWSNNFGTELINFPLDQLTHQINQYHNLDEHLQGIQEEIDLLRISQKELIKSPPIYLMPLLLIGETLILIGRHNPSSKLVHAGNSLITAGFVGNRSDYEIYQKQEDQIIHRNSEYHKNFGELEIQGNAIKETLSSIPLKKSIFENLTIELHDQLVKLKSYYEQIDENRLLQSELEKEYERFELDAAALLYALEFSIEGDMNQLVSIIRKVYDEASRHKNAAIRAKQILEHTVKPALIDHRIQNSSLQEELQNINIRLEELGGGSIERGVELVKEIYEFLRRVAETRIELVSLYPNIQLTEKKIRDHGWKILEIAFKKDVENIDHEIIFEKESLKDICNGLDRVPKQYLGIDEPIRRFLLYGGPSADDFLVSSVHLFASMAIGELDDNIQHLRLPQNFVEKFQKWWEYKQTIEEIDRYRDEETDTTTGQKFRAPQIFFEPSTAEVQVIFPPQLLLTPRHNENIYLKVYTPNIQEEICRIHLNLYQHSQELVQSYSQEFALPIPSSSYRFSLQGNTAVINEWESVAPGDGDNYLVFDTLSHKLIKEQILPKGPLTFLLRTRFTIDPPECVLVEGNSLIGDWGDYIWYQADLTSVDELWLVDEGNQRFQLSIASFTVPSLELIGGKVLKGVLSDERPMFVEPPDYIRIPLNDLGELALMRLSIFAEKGKGDFQIKHVQIEDLMNIIEDHLSDGWLDIPLKHESLLGQLPMGNIDIRVYKSPYLDRRFSFCVSPQITINFDQEFYLPYVEEPYKAVVTLTLLPNCTFKPRLPARIHSMEGNEYQILVPISENEFVGAFYISNNNFTLPISIVIPKVMWRIQGLDDSRYDIWLDRVAEEEFWIGDWTNSQELFLVVKTPLLYEGKVSLSITSNSDPISVEEVADGNTRFDLKALEDMLRSGSSLETFSLSFTDSQSHIKDVNLFSIRTRWEAENIKCFQYPEGKVIRLNITWDEKGKADEKVVRMWYISTGKTHIVHQEKVPQDISEVEIKIKSRKLISGNYLIHIEPYNEWSSQPLTPPKGKQNIILVEIIIEKPKETILIRRIWVNPSHCYDLPIDSYKIKIIGKVSNLKLPDEFEKEDIGRVLVKRLNEDWYVGILEVKGFQDVIDHLGRTNPVKIEYDSDKQEVTSIEDRQGDGTVYCHECNMLFWSQEMVLKEKRINHRNYGPIERFCIDWKIEE